MLNLNPRRQSKLVDAAQQRQIALADQVRLVDARQPRALRHRHDQRHVMPNDIATGLARTAFPVNQVARFLLAQSLAFARA